MYCVVNCIPVMLERQTPLGTVRPALLEGNQNEYESSPSIITLPWKFCLRLRLMRSLPCRDALYKIDILCRLFQARKTIGMKPVGRFSHRQDLRTIQLYALECNPVMTRSRTKHAYNPSRAVLCSYGPINNLCYNFLTLPPSARPQPGTGPPLEVIEVDTG